MHAGFSDSSIISSAFGNVEVYGAACTSFNDSNPNPCSLVGVNMYASNTNTPHKFHYMVNTNTKFKYTSAEEDGSATYPTQISGS
jgi:hypothetical protein